MVVVLLPNSAQQNACNFNENTCKMKIIFYVTEQLFSLPHDWENSSNVDPRIKLSLIENVLQTKNV